MCGVDPELRPPSSAPPDPEHGSPITRENAGLLITNASNIPRTNTRQEAKDMNRKRQIAQGNKERKILERSVGSSGVGPGAVVVVRNDPGDISHAHGTMGVSIIVVEQLAG